MLTYKQKGAAVMWVNFNANPAGHSVGDCTVRAISRALNQPWEKTYIGLCLQGLMCCDMPSANVVWGRYLIDNGFKRHMIPDACADMYSVEQFCTDHPQGVYVLAISGHVVCVINGNYYDTWNSGQCVPLYYWERVTDDV